MIRDRDRLEAHGSAELRRVTLEVVEAGLAACDPRESVRHLVRPDDAGVTIGAQRFPFGPDSRLLIVGAGKASLRVAEELVLLLDRRIDRGLIVVPRGQGRRLPYVNVIEADHPLPSPASLEAGLAVLDLATSAGPADLVIACFTGGSSALVSVPPADVSLFDKVELHRLLVYSGASIVEINAVRKHVSRIKGGRLAQAAAPARLVNLSVSDVAGNPLDAITDLTVQDSTTVADSIAVVHRYDLWDRIPGSVKRHLSWSPSAESPDLDETAIDTFLLVTGDQVCRAMTIAAARLGYVTIRTDPEFEGDAVRVGRHAVHAARKAAKQATGRPYVILGCGGESTVAMVDSVNVGAGGPNQEAALAAALALRPTERMAVAFVDTDGCDGGTDIAGAVVDNETARRAEEVGLDLDLALKDHASTAALRRLGDVIVTGPTGTNVNDLFVVTVAGQNDVLNGDSRRE